MRQTVEPLSKKTGIPIDTRFSVDDPESVAETIATEFPEDEQGTVLVCWEHKVLVEICEMLLSHDGREKAGKLKWPKEDFDSIWVVQDGELSFYKQGFDIEIWNSTAEERKKKRIEDLGIGRGGLIRRMTSWVVGEPIDEVRGEGKEERPVFEGAKKAERTDSGGSGGKGGGVSRTDSGSKEGKGDLAGPGGLGTPTRTDSGKARMPMPSSPPIGPSLPSSPPKAPLLTVSLPDTDAVATIHADMPVNLIPPVLDAVKDSIVTLGEPKTDDEGTDGEKKKAKKDKKKGKEVIPVDATGIAPTAEEPRPSVDLSPPRQSTESAPLLAVPGKPLKKKKKDKKKDKVKTLLRTDSVQVLGFDGRYGLYGEMDEREREKGDEVGEGFCCGLCSGCTIL